MNKLFSLQVLRAIAALIVVLAHLDDIERKSGGGGATLLGKWANTGIFGVDLFFVLSGFIMVVVSTKQEGSLRQSAVFLRNRTTRIFPLWWLCFGALVPIWLLKPEMIYGGMTDVNLLKDAFLIWDGHSPLLQSGWTLIHEVYFYVIFSLILLVPLGHANRLSALLFWALIVATCALIIKPGSSTYLHVILHPMTLEFVGGAIAAYAWQKGNGRLAGTSLTIGLTVLIVGISVLATRLYDAPVGTATSHIFSSWDRTLWFGTASVFIVYGFVGLETRGLLKFSGLPVKIGDWSYSLYLTHMLTINAAGLVWKKLSHPGLIDNAIAIPLILVVCVIVSWLSFIIVERPSMILSRKYIERVLRTQVRGRPLFATALGARFPHPT